MRHLFESVGGHVVDYLHVHLDPCALLSLRYAQCYPFNFFTTRLHVFIFTNCPPHPSEAICSLPRFRSHDVFNKIKMAAKLTVRKSSTEQKNWMTQFFRSTFADSAHCLLDWVSLRLNVCKFSQKLFEQSLRLRVPRLYLYKGNVWEIWRFLQTIVCPKLRFQKEWTGEKVSPTTQFWVYLWQWISMKESPFGIMSLEKWWPNVTSGQISTCHCFLAIVLCWATRQDHITRDQLRFTLLRETHLIFSNLN